MPYVTQKQIRESLEQQVKLLQKEVLELKAQNHQLLSVLEGQEWQTKDKKLTLALDKVDPEEHVRAMNDRNIFLENFSKGFGYRPPVDSEVPNGAQ